MKPIHRLYNMLVDVKDVVVEMSMIALLLLAVIVAGYGTFYVVTH